MGTDVSIIVAVTTSTVLLLFHFSHCNRLPYVTSLCRALKVSKNKINIKWWAPACRRSPRCQLVYLSSRDDRGQRDLGMPSSEIAEITRTEITRPPWFAVS